MVSPRHALRSLPSPAVLEMQRKADERAQFEAAQKVQHKASWVQDFRNKADMGAFLQKGKRPVRLLPVVNSDSGQPNPRTRERVATTTSSFDITLLKKEFLYAKLKYSRCPQYDIVSGGFAALFAGFIGFLISEKFGIELPDSGDFYIAMMYGAMICLGFKPLLFTFSRRSPNGAPYSYRHGLRFAKVFTVMFILRPLKNLLNPLLVLISSKIYSPLAFELEGLYRLLSTRLALVYSMTIVLVLRLRKLLK